MFAIIPKSTELIFKPKKAFESRLRSITSLGVLAPIPRPESMSSNDVGHHPAADWNAASPMSALSTWKLIN